MKKWGIRLVLVLALVLAAWALRRTVLAPEPIEVQVVEASLGLVEESVTNSRAGTVKARRRARLSPEIGGRVVELPFREGERVTAGAVLLRLDPSLPAAEVKLAQRQLAAAGAERQRVCFEADRADRELARVRRLADDGIVSTDNLDQAETAAQASRAACSSFAARLEQAQASVDLRRSFLDQTVLRAPFDGIIADLAVEIGEYTTPSPPAVPVPPVIDILDPTSMYISAPMDEVDSGRIRLGQLARVTIDSYRDRSFPGQISRVAPYVEDVERQNRTVEIEVELEDSTLAATLLPGTSADVEIILEAKQDVLRLPTSALLQGTKVLILNAGTLEERSVTPGLRNWNFTEISSGLEPGQEVVSSLDRAEVKAGVEAIAANTTPGGNAAQESP
ncbi:MAG: efflux RND transporter periplasmic adaptor subunit [Deltaproteobacteria bacterium]|nr:efflux RND transporter periplasmic adaptor subunit [Deltaproteobacteria bacterium]